MSENRAANRARIMIVDDTPENLQLLKRMLQDCGCDVFAHPDGELALRAVDRFPPDLILLDINMPDMDGYEVCRRLKANPRTQDVPVIFLSALNQTEDKIKAFALGGEDFITKPFQFDEVKARVEAHLKLHRYRVLLEEKNRALDASYKELKEMELVRDALVHMMIHDMRNLIFPIYTGLEMIQQMESEKLSSDGKLLINRATTSTYLLMEMISTVLDVSKMESDAMEIKAKSCDLCEIFKRTLEPLQAYVDKGALVLDIPEKGLEATCDANLIGRVVLNLVSNALKFNRASLGPVIVNLKANDGNVCVSVEDHGPGIPEEHQSYLFEKFKQAPFDGDDRVSRRYSTGLGLTFCKMAVEAHGSQIKVESEVDKGSRFCFELPKI